MSAPGHAKKPDDPTAGTDSEPAHAGDLCQDRMQTVALVYPELRRIAQRLLRRERSYHTLQPTALANEALARLLERQAAGWSPRQLLAYGLREMRTILIDSGRRYRVRIRHLDGASEEDARTEASVEALAQLYLVLDKLEAVDPRARMVAELRYMVGLTVEETAEILGVSKRIVSLDWRFARCWLAEHWGSVPAGSGPHTQEELGTLPNSLDH